MFIAQLVWKRFSWWSQIINAVVYHIRYLTYLTFSIKLIFSWPVASLKIKDNEVEDYIHNLDTDLKIQKMINTATGKVIKISWNDQEPVRVDTFSSHLASEGAKVKYTWKEGRRRRSEVEEEVIEMDDDDDDEDVRVWKDQTRWRSRSQWRWRRILYICISI